VITIGIDPTIEPGPITVAWHGLMIAVGIVVGGLAVAHDARRRGLDPDRVHAIGLIPRRRRARRGRRSICASATSSTIQDGGPAPPCTVAVSTAPDGASPTRPSTGAGSCEPLGRALACRGRWCSAADRPITGAWIA
jgi:hypothetical protein